MPPSYTPISATVGTFDPEHRFVTSWLLHPLGLASLRLVFALFCWANLFVTFGYDAVHEPGSIGAQFSYFTNLTWWGITCYMTIAALHTFVYVRRGYTFLDRWWRPLQLLHSFFYTTIVTYPFLVTIVYWVLLYKAPWFTNPMDAFRNISRHGLNSLAALSEIILPATNPPPFSHIPFLVILLGSYLGLAYITYATQGFYTYNFLNPAHGAGLLAGYIVGIALASVVIFLLVWGLIWTRRRFTGIGKRSKKDPGLHAHVEYDADVEMTVK